jgi:hypothetical protein
LPNELINSVTSLVENPDTGEQAYPLSRNSRHIKKLLITTGYLKDDTDAVSNGELVSQESKEY